MRLYRWLLRAFPGPLRREYGAAMEETLERRLADAHAARWARARVWGREIASLLLVAIAERWRVRHRYEEPHRKVSPMDRMSLEVRHAVRRLLRSPAFTVASVLTLALAIGGNASIFAVVQRVVLNPLPYPDSDQLIEVDHGSQRMRVAAGFGMTSGLYFHYGDRAQTLESIALYALEDVTVTGDGDPERIRISRATPSLAAVMRVTPSHGRWLTHAEGEPGAPPRVVLSDAMWTRRFKRDPGVVGRALMLGGVQTEVVGIMPPAFGFPDARVDAWVADRLSRASGFGLWGRSGVARLKPGVTIEEARTELTSLIADLPQAYPNDPRALGNVQTNLIFSGRTLKDALVGSIAPALWILLASSVLVLLVACANVANLFLVRSEARQREVAVRSALGAGRGGIARYFLTESVLLAIAGGALGQLIAWGAVRLLVTYGPATLPRLSEVRMDPTIYAFTFGLSVFAALAFGAIPFLRNAPSAASLHETGRANTASRGRFRARHLLMGSQIAMALVLLIASGLMLRSFQQLRALDPGFDGTSALTFSIGLSPNEYQTRESAAAAHRAILDRLSALPGATRVSATTCLPLARGCNGNTVRIEGQQYPEGTIPPLAMFRAVAGDYVETMGMRLLRGRTLSRGDVDRREPFVVINEAFAKNAFADEDPLGRRLASNRSNDPSRLDWLTVVGVVSNTPVHTLTDAPQPQIFMPMSIAGGPGIPLSALSGPDISVMSYVVRTATRPAELMPAVRLAVGEFNDNLAIARVRTLQEILDAASSQMAFTMVLLAIAAGIALTLGVVGTYGVMSYIVSQRTGEIGVRLALGAEPGGVARQILQQGGLVALAGVAAGLAAALAGSRVIESLLYGVSPRDPSIFAATTVILLSVALLACWLPARRASRLSPVEALRVD